jgi:hypothetical protein
MISPDELRQYNVKVRSSKIEFERLYRPLGNRYLRGLDSYMYNRNQPALSMAQRLMKQGLSPMGTKEDNVFINIPASASDAQRMEYLYRQNAMVNRPRVDNGATFPLYSSGLSTGAMNRNTEHKDAIGMIYLTTRRDTKRIPDIIPPVY